MIITDNVGDYSDEITNIVLRNEEAFGKVTLSDMVRAHFHAVLINDDVAGFFAISKYRHDDFDEAVLCFVYVHSHFRRKGIFGKIVEFVVEKCRECKLIGLWAESGNELAKSIYSRKFKFIFEDSNGDCYYAIKDER